MKPAALSDPELVDAILADQADAKELAWLRFVPTVRSVLRRFGSRFMDQDDVVQEVFFTFFRKLPQLRDPAAVRGFIIAITVRTAKHHARRGYQRWQIEKPVAPELLGSEVEATDDLQARHELARVEDLLRTARPRDRAVFVLRVVAGMTTEEAARTLGISIATAVRSIARAQAHLKCRAQRDVFLVTYA